MSYRMNKISALLLAATLTASVSVPAMAEEETFAPTVTSRGIIINEDAHNTLCGAISDPSWKETSTTGRPIKYDLTDKDAVLAGIKQTMHNYANTQVTDVVIPTNFQYSFSDSDVMEDVDDKWNAATTWASVSNGAALDFSKTMVEVFHKVIYDYNIDVYREWFTQLEKDNINGWISIRMNDIHDYKQLNGQRNSLFNYTAYDKGLTVGSHLGGDYQGAYGCLNYSKEEVYNRYIKYIEEQVTRYGDIIDGVELDFQREAFCFAPGEEENGRTIMTKFLREVKAIADKTGKGIQVSVRVPRDLTQCYDSGFDVLEWAKEGLINTVTVSTRNATCDTDMPIASWVKIFDKYGVKINAGTEILYRSAGNKSYAREANLENDYALAAQYLSEGADKMYYFNHYTTWIEGNNQPFDSSNVLNLGTRLDLLNNAGSPETLEDKNKAYLVSYQDITGNFYDDTYRYDPLPITAAANSTSENLRIKTGNIPSDADAAVLVGFTRGDSAEIGSGDITVAVNGENCTTAEEVLCMDGLDDETYYSKFFETKNGQKWYKNLPPQYRIGSKLGVKRAYAYEIPVSAADNMEQVLNFHNNTETDIDINYVELRVMPQMNTENHLYKSCVDYADCRQTAAGMRTTAGDLRAVAKLYTSQQYGGAEWVKYNVEALSSGVYEVRLCASPSVLPFKVSMSSEYNALKEFELTGSGYLRRSLGEITLMKGENNIVMKAVTDGTIYLDYLEFIKIKDIAEEDTKEYVTISHKDYNTTESSANTFFPGATGMTLYNNAKVAFDFETKYDGMYDLDAYFKQDGYIIYLEIDGIPYAKTIKLTDEKFESATNQIYYKSDFGAIALKSGSHKIVMERDGEGIINFNKFELSRIGNYANTHIGINSVSDRVFEANTKKSYNVTVPATGYYAISYVYSMADNAEGKLQVSDGTASADLAVQTTAGVMKSAAAQEMIYLREGDNTITVTNTGEHKILLNRVFFDYSKGTEIPLKSFDEQSSTYDKNQATASWVHMYAGGKLVYNISVAEGGKYKLCLNTVNTYADYTYTVSLDGTAQASKKISKNANLTWAQGSDNFVADLDITAGNHTLTLDLSGSESNLFSVILYKISE